MFACLHLSRKKFNRIFPSLIDLLFMQWQASWKQFWLWKEAKGRRMMILKTQLNFWRREILPMSPNNVSP